nr:IclR family transcriptional regulator C-terminal domain-containing protein [Roseateles terrae]
MPSEDLDPSLKPGDSYVQSFARGLSVIRAFGADAPRQTLTEVAKRCGLTRAGARRILLTLQTLGYVRAEGRLFELTPKILDLGFAYLSSQPLWQFAEPQMLQLTGDLKESCSIAVLDAQDIVFVMRTPTRKIFNEALGVGSRLPAWATAMGRVMLAALPPEELDHRLPAALLSASGGQNGATASANPSGMGGISAAPGVAFPSPAPAYGGLQGASSASSTPRNAEELRAALDQVRQQGWCLLERELEEGLVTLAVPIQGRQGRVIASIALHAQTSRTSPQLLLEQGLPKLQETAQSLSRLLQIKG